MVKGRRCTCWERRWTVIQAIPGYFTVDWPERAAHRASPPRRASAEDGRGGATAGASASGRAISRPGCLRRERPARVPTVRSSRQIRSLPASSNRRCSERSRPLPPSSGPCDLPSEPHRWPIVRWSSPRTQASQHRHENRCRRPRTRHSRPDRDAAGGSAAGSHLARPRRAASTGARALLSFPFESEDRDQRRIRAWLA